jgi:hypothetical protein
MSRAETKRKELELGVSSVIELMNRLYGAQDLIPEEEAQRKLGDMRLENRLVELIKMIVRLRKISESYRDEGLQSVGYEMLVQIDCDKVEYNIKYRSGTSAK